MLGCFVLVVLNPQILLTELVTIREHKLLVWRNMGCSEGHDESLFGK